MGKRRKTAGGGRRVEHVTDYEFSAKKKPAVIPTLENDPIVELEDTRDASKIDVELTKYKKIYGNKESFMT